MKTHTRLSLAALALAALASAARAQAQDSWVAVSPEGERFTARMPAEPASVAQQLGAGELKVEGRRYEAAGADGTSYLVLSLADAEGAGERMAAAGYRSERFQRESRYLDEIAGLAWEALVQPEAERLRRESRGGARMTMSYRREFELSGRPAREYFISSQRKRGPVYVCADGPRIYVVAALGADLQAASLAQFLSSFELKTEAAAPETKADPAAATGAGIGPGLGGGVSGADAGRNDYALAFATNEVAEKARITAKPEPLYTDEARKFHVTGTVRVRVVLAATGEVERVEVVKGLPHGLTLSAVEAARKISFEPARRDGRPVSQYVNIEYNFNIY